MPEEQEEQADISRPVTLYVEKIETKPTITQFFERRRVSVIDIELPIIQATELIEHLKKRSDKGHTGTIRIRFLGRLIHV